MLGPALFLYWEGFLPLRYLTSRGLISQSTLKVCSFLGSLLAYASLSSWQKKW